MALALAEARKAAEMGEVPVGCVIAGPAGAVIGRGGNRRERDGSVLAHAEMLAIEEACRGIGDWRLDGCTLYVTLEPCPMCAGAIINARIAHVYYGASDREMGACGGVLNLFMERFPHRPRLTGGIMGDACTRVLQTFFHELREKD